MRRTRSTRTRLAVAVAVVASAAVVAAALLSTTRTAGAATSTLTPVADAHVRSDRAASNFGAASGLLLDGRPVASGYLRFDVSVPAGESVTRATLRVFATKKANAGFTVHGVSDNGWGETAITYANAPAIGAQVAASGPQSANAYVSVDVTPLVSGSGPVSMALKRSASTATTYHSREASNPPQLVVESAAEPPPPTGQTVVYDR